MTAEQQKSILDYALVNGILDGEACETIARRAREGGFDPVGTGTRGRSALPNLALGSVAAKVMHFADVPVKPIK